MTEFSDSSITSIGEGNNARFIIDANNPFLPPMEVTQEELLTIKKTWEFFDFTWGDKENYSIPKTGPALALWVKRFREYRAEWEETINSLTEEKFPPNLAGIITRAKEIREKRWSDGAADRTRAMLVKMGLAR